MTATRARTSAASVWGSTWIPGPCPIEGLGDDRGYSIAWVRVHDGPMLQVVVDADAPPAPGTSGEIRSVAVDEESIDVFTPSAGVRA